MKKSPYLLILILLVSFADALRPQTNNLRLYDYSKVDAHAQSLGNKYKDLDKLARDLTQGFTKDHEKVRVIFTWIAENIAYDTKAAHKKSASISFSYSSEEELKQLMAEENERIILEVLKKGRGVCEGYARIFKTLCEKSGLQVALINGYARNTPDIRVRGITNNSNHTWNAVLLDNRWYLLDPTWAAGYTDPGITKFTREFRPAYFLTPPELMILDHFPEDPKWQLLDQKVTWNEFTGFPLIKAGFLKYNISDYEPRNGVITARTGRSIDFAFNSEQAIDEILVHRSNEKYSNKATYNKEGKRYRFQYVPERSGNFHFTIYVNGESLLIYKVEVR